MENQIYGRHQQLAKYLNINVLQPELKIGSICMLRGSFSTVGEKQRTNYILGEIVQTGASSLDEANHLGAVHLSREAALAVLGLHASWVRCAEAVLHVESPESAI